MSLAAPRVAIVIPAYNAGAEIGAVIQGVRSIMAPDDIWVVDDGSTDDTAEVVRSFGVQLIRQSPNQGKASALRRAFDATIDYDLVITLDADGQHDPADLAKFFNAAECGDLIVGSRPLSGSMPWHRQVGNRFASWVTSKLAGHHVPDSQSGYRLHSRALIDAVVGAIPVTCDGYLFETEILIRASRQGFRLGTVPIRAHYDGAPSHFHPWREIPRFVALFVRLTLLLWKGDIATAAPGQASTPRSSGNHMPDLEDG